MGVSAPTSTVQNRAHTKHRPGWSGPCPEALQPLWTLFPLGNVWVFSLYAIVISLVATCAAVSRSLAGHFKKALVLFSL